MVEREAEMRENVKRGMNTLIVREKCGDGEVREGEAGRNRK